MNKLFKSIVVLLALTACVMNANAQKLGYINSQILLDQMPEVKESSANIETLKKQLQKKGQEMITELQQKYVALQRQQEEGSISPVQLEKEAAKLKEEETRIGEFERTSQEKIIKKTEELLAPIQTKINTAIQDVAEANGYTYIFDSSMGMVLYAAPENDVTALVKAKLGL